MAKLPNFNISLFSLGFILLLAPNLSFSEQSSKGEIRLESRLFDDDKVDATQDYGLGLSTILELSSESKNFKSKLQLFSRTDAKDPSRATFFVQEAYLQYFKGNIDIKFGTQILNWTATEAFHPVDGFNSRNLDSEFESTEKIGEPLLNLTYLFDSANVSFFHMPLSLPNKYPAYTNRLSFLSDSGIELGKAYYVKNDGEITTNLFVPQFGARFEISVGDMDISVHHLQHINRSKPTFEFDATDSKIHPVYYMVKQTGGTLQWVIDSWILKVESAYFDFADMEVTDLGMLEQKNHGETAIGIEWGWSHENGAESTVILEGQKLTGLEPSEAAALSFFQSDALWAYRWALNDVDSQEVMFSFIWDFERSKELFYHLKYSRRLTDQWFLKMGAKIVDAPPKENIPLGAELYHNDHQYYLNISRFF